MDEEQRLKQNMIITVANLIEDHACDGAQLTTKHLCRLLHVKQNRLYELFGPTKNLIEAARKKVEE